MHQYEWLRGRGSFVLIFVTNHHARDQVIAVLQEWGYAAGRDFL